MGANMVKMPPSKQYPAYFETMPSQKGKIVAITGCTSGTGLAAAIAVAQKGGTVIMLNRSSNRAEEAETKVKEAAPDAEVVTVSCDLMNFASVKEAAVQVTKLFPQGIDALGNNAGITVGAADLTTNEGYNSIIQVNHLSHFLLTRELFPLLEKAAARTGEARIVNMTSLGRNGPFPRVFWDKGGDHVKINAKAFGTDLKELEAIPHDMLGDQYYHQSKLAACVFTYALNDRLQQCNSKVKVMLAMPGWAATSIVEKANMSKWPMAIGALLGQLHTAEDGATNLLLPMCNKYVESGDFYEPQNKCVGPPTRTVPDRWLFARESKDTLWEVSTAAVGPFELTH